MSPWWFASLVAPAALFALALRHPGFAAQPAVTGSGNHERFRRAVEKAGGPAAVRGGPLPDLVFIAVFASVSALLLSGADGWWWLPLVAAALDLLQDGLLVVALDGAPGAGLLRGILGVTIVMYAAYLVTLGALAVALADTVRAS